MKMRSVLIAIVLLGASGAAVADRDDTGIRGRDLHDGWVKPRESKNVATTLQAPEIDPASLVAALTLLGGGLIVMRGRRTSKTPV